MNNKLESLAQLRMVQRGDTLTIIIGNDQYLWMDSVDFFYWVGRIIRLPEFNGKWEEWIAGGNWDYLAENGEDVHQIYLHTF